MWQFGEELKREGMCECPSNVAFVFADNNKDKKREHRLIERSYSLCSESCHYYHIAQEYTPWDWFGKIGPMKQLILSDHFKQQQFEFIVLTDADDQTLIRSPHDIVPRFLSYDCDILLAGEATSYPKWMKHESHLENILSPWSKHHQHLNAGGMMARVDCILPYLEFMERDYNETGIKYAKEIEESGKHKWRDQTCWRQMALKYYPKIKIDSLSKIWSRVDIYINDL